jgi:hypothetical protein
MLISMILIECRAQALIVVFVSLTRNVSKCDFNRTPNTRPRYFCQEFQQNTDNGRRIAYQVMED